jgi:uncharacterized membrane protein YhhN
MHAIPAAAELWILVTLAALALHLLAEAREWATARAVTKLIASTGFLLTAHAAGALAPGWSRWIVGGLALSWIGDACLLGRASASFIAGLVAFLLGHVSYCVAFVVLGFAPMTAMIAAPILAVVALVVDRWLRDHVGEMRVPVRAYILVISTMLVLAIAAWREGASHLLLIGAVSFYLSDLSVARDRFIQPALGNRLWGLPAYYLGQLCLALAVLGLR